MSGTVPAAGRELRPSPFLHVDADAISNPLTGRVLRPSDPDHRWLVQVVQGSAPAAELPAEVRERLRQGLWLVPPERDLSREFRLRYVSLETHTVCNQSCFFCPVSQKRRRPYFMESSLFERIVDQLAQFTDTIEAVSTINYNEPTVDPRFVDHVRRLHGAGLPVAVVTNGWGLTPAVADQLLELGGVRHLIVNLSTRDPERYRRERGADHVRRVLANLEYLKDLPLAQEMKIVVLGTGDQQHRADFADISSAFEGVRLRTEYHEVMDRAGHLPIGLRPDAPHERLGGCDNVGSRPLEHLHITPHGHCLLCCEDYDERYRVGDLNRQTVREVLEGDELARLRRWVYGLEEAPADFMCRGCIFARTRPAAPPPEASDPALELRPLAPPDGGVVNATFNAVFATHRSDDEWRWKFGPAPAGMLAWRGEQLLAQYAALPVRLQVDGREWDAAQIVDVFSTPEARRLFGRRGVWVRTAERFFAEFGASGRLPLLFGFPGRRALRLGVLQLGYDTMPPQPITYLRRTAAARRRPLRTLAYRADLVDPADERLDRLWREVRDQYPVAVVRDARRLGRRLANHPTVRYHTFLVTRRLGARPVGFVAFRTDGGVCRWVDLLWHHDHRGALELAARLGRALALQTGAQLEELWLNGDPTGREVLEGTGFEVLPEPNELVMVARSFAPDLPVGALAGRVYLTMADADLV